MNGSDDQLKGRTARAAGFRLVGNLGATLLTLALGVVLARLLPPEEFGLFGLALAVVAIAEVVGGCGMLEAVIQRPVITRQHEAAAAFVQLGAALLLGTALAASSETVAGFFEMEGLEPILELQVLVLPLTALALVPTTRLSRRLEFGRLAAVDVVSRLLGGVLAIAAALQGYGAVALVYGALASAAVRLVGLWSLAGGRPALSFSWSDLGDLYRFSAGMMGVSIANILARRVDVLIIGATLGSSSVGLYQRAFQLVLLPFEQLIGPINKVLFPALASVSRDHARVLRGYLAVSRLSALVGFPVMALLAVNGDLLISVVYGPMWVEAGPILQLLALSGFFRILYKTHGVLVQAKGRPGAEAVRQVVFLALVAGLAWIGSRVGILGVVVGVVVASMAFCVLMTRLALKLSGSSPAAWLSTIRTGALASIVAACTVALLRAIVGDITEWLELFAGLGCGAIAYAVALRLMMDDADRTDLGGVIDVLPGGLRRLGRTLAGVDRAAQPASRGVA